MACCRLTGAPGTAARCPGRRRYAQPDHESAEYLTGREDDLFDGVITLVDQGCAYSSLLIVTGPHQGAVVNIDPDLSGAPYFTRDAGFLAWYERWLDELLWGWDGHWFGFGLPGRESELAQALLGPSGSDRREALRTLLRIPVLSADALSAVTGCANDPDPAVRVAALAILGKQSSGTAAIIARLRDTEPAVRAAAVRGLPRSGVSARHWRAALADPDPAVVRNSLRLLASHDRLTAADLAPLLTASLPEMRSTAVYYLEKTDAQTVPAAMFTDPATAVVRQAVLTAGSLNDERSIPLLRHLLSNASEPSLRTLITKSLERISGRDKL